MQHATGVWDWGGLCGIGVWPRTLCPRPETELLVDFLESSVTYLSRGDGTESAESVVARAVVAGGSMSGIPLDSLVASTTKMTQALQTAVTEDRRAFQPTRPVRVLDVCSGSGAIGLALLARLPHGTATVVSVDVDDRCRRLGAANASVFGLHEATAFLQADAAVSWGFSGLEQEIHRAFAKLAPRQALASSATDIVVMNPPYLTASTSEFVWPHVTRCDGPTALYGGGNHGLDLALRLLRALSTTSAVRPNAVVVLELGSPQVDQLRMIIENGGLEGRLRWLTGAKDQYKRPRFAILGVNEPRQSKHQRSVDEQGRAGLDAFSGAAQDADDDAAAAAGSVGAA